MTAFNGTAEYIVKSARRNQPKTGLVERFIIGLFTDLIGYLFGGLGLMVLAPLAHEHLGTPDVRPGYWGCVLVVLWANVTLVAFRRAKKDGES